MHANQGDIPSFIEGNNTKVIEIGAEVKVEIEIGVNGKIETSRVELTEVDSPSHSGVLQ